MKRRGRCSSCARPDIPPNRRLSSKLAATFLRRIRTRGSVDRPRPASGRLPPGDGDASMLECLPLKIALIGGGGLRTPLTYQALLGDGLQIDELVLHDVDAARLERVELVLRGIDHEREISLQRQTTTDLEQAVDGADYVLCAIRVGGLAGRV